MSYPYRSNRDNSFSMNPGTYNPRTYMGLSSRQQEQLQNIARMNPFSSHASGRPSRASTSGTMEPGYGILSYGEATDRRFAALRDARQEPDSSPNSFHTAPSRHASDASSSRHGGATLRGSPLSGGEFDRRGSDSPPPRRYNWCPGYGPNASTRTPYDGSMNRDSTGGSASYATRGQYTTGGRGSDSFEQHTRRSRPDLSSRYPSSQQQQQQYGRESSRSYGGGYGQQRRSQYVSRRSESSESDYYDL